jgi:predicted nucleic acid-binding protein
MKVFVDTNVFIASLTDEPGRGDTATRLLNQDHDFCTSIFDSQLLDNGAVQPTELIASTTPRTVARGLSVNSASADRR